MKFTITREQFQEGLQAVAGSVPTKTTLPVLSNILVEATHDGVRLSGTDLDIAVSTTVPFAFWVILGCQCFFSARQFLTILLDKSFGAEFINQKFNPRLGALVQIGTLGGHDGFQTF